MNYIKEYVIALIIFLIIDGIWLVFISKDLYKQALGPLMAGQVNFIAAIIFYLIFIAGIVFFVIHPAVVSGNVLEALLKGAFLGLLCYATYDLTNLAALKDWPLHITIIDLLWGTFITSITSFITTYLVLLIK